MLVLSVIELVILWSCGLSTMAAEWILRLSKKRLNRSSLLNLLDENEGWDLPTHSGLFN